MNVRSVVRYCWLLLSAPVRHVAYFLSGCVPRDERIWVFGSWDGVRFADNSKWFFLHCTNAGYPLRCVWVSRDRSIVDQVRASGREAYLRGSPRGLWLCLRAQYHILDHSSDDIAFVTSRRARRILLFHGIPLKKLRRDIENRDNFNYKVYRGSRLQRLLFRFTRPRLYESYDLVTASSAEVGELYASAFGVPPDRVAVTGLPRNDVILDESLATWPGDRALIAKLADLKRSGRKIVLYLPTWRDHQRSSAGEIDWEALAAFFSDRNAVFVHKRHSYASASSLAPSSVESIIELDAAADIYALLGFSDALVTDYSSIAFDYMLLRRPIIFYCYDIDDYLTGARSFYFDYHSVTPGKKISRFDDLLAALDAALDPDNYMAPWTELYADVLRRLHTHPDSGSGRRVYAAIRRLGVNAR